jgi:hypothetical protein
MEKINNNKTIGNTSNLIEDFVFRTSLKEQFYLKIGSTWTLDSLYVYLHLPLAMLGFVLNLISFRTFSNMKLRQKRSYYSYLKVYTFNSCLVCFLSIFTFLFAAPRYFSFALTSLASFYKCVISVWLSTLVYFFLNVLDCLLLLERISNLTNSRRIKSFFKYDPWLICFCIFLICNLINLPSFFIARSRNDDYYAEVMGDQEKIKVFTYCYREPFFLTVDGRIVIILVVILRDICTLLTELYLSIYSFILFKRYLSQRAMVLYLSPNFNDSTNQTNVSKENRAHINEAIENDDLDPNYDMTTSSSNNNNVRINNQNIRDIITKAEKYNSRLTRMTIYLSIFSLMSHFGIAITFIDVSLDDRSMFLFVSSFISCFLSVFKYACNFFLFYRFNKSFRSHLKCI